MTIEKKIENQKNELRKFIIKIYILVEKTMKRDPSYFYPRKTSNKTFLTASDVYDSIDKFVFGIMFASETLSLDANVEIDSKYINRTISSIKSYMIENGRNINLSVDQLYEEHYQMVAKNEFPEILNMLSDYEKKYREGSFNNFMVNLGKNLHDMRVLQERMSNSNFSK